MSDTPTMVRWVRALPTRSASRTDGIAVAFDQNRWLLMAQGTTYVLRTPGFSQNLDRAVDDADQFFPPAPWTFTEGVWSFGVWQIRPNADGTWGVFREVEGTVEQASIQLFPSADRARRWAELRFDRGSSRLRGPKPRAGSRASEKLPDVRVTEDEKAHAMAILGRLGLGYSDFVRAALVWAEAQVLAEGAGWSVVRGEDGSYSFSERDNA